MVLGPLVNGKSCPKTRIPSGSGRADLIMKYREQLGFDPTTHLSVDHSDHLVEFANIKLASRGLPIFGQVADYPVLGLSRSLLNNLAQKNRLLGDHLCPVDRRVQTFLDDYLADTGEPIAHLPGDVLNLERHGLARTLSLPPDRDFMENELVTSVRVHQGVLHNPASDRRTTQGVFHVTEGGYPIPDDKKAVPKATFARLLTEALHPPASLLRLPFTASQEEQAETFVGLLLRPTVCPEVPGVTSRKNLEVRFVLPGSLVCNLDFVESIFGNAGDPLIPENDAALDPDWTGHTGYIVLAPHLVRTRKKALGLPHISKATERQKRDGMCWENEDECYNDGGAFKLTARDHRGVVVTLIADNYFGYCKKEVKTQISFAANLYGMAEEEHAGGAIAFASYDLGEDFDPRTYFAGEQATFEDVKKRLGDSIELHPYGYAIDKGYADIHFVPEDALFSLSDQTIRWGETSIRLQPGITYVLPHGYKVEMLRPAEGRRWRLIGTVAEGTFCHKPCTVSGGGKSEIAKSIGDAILTGPVFTNDFQKEFDLVEEIVRYNYGHRFQDASRNRNESRSLLSPERSLGSVIKLLTPSSEYTDEYNEWVRGIPLHVKDLVFVVKRFYKPDWGDDWRSRFTVDVINGSPAKELRYRGLKLITQYLRVGFTDEGAWRTFTLRKDFHPAAKIQTEDDISASVTVPVGGVANLNPEYQNPSVKFVENVEYRLFQRPDEGIHRGYDKKTELDFSRKGVFFSNYEPLSRETVQDLSRDVIRFTQYTAPLQQSLTEFLANGKPDYAISSAHPRIVDGKPTKNPRYLQNRDDLEDPRCRVLGEIGVRLHRRIPAGEAVPMPVNAVLPGRRNNPPDRDAGIGALCVFNPIHYQEFPELFMDFVASLTGRSPSTTGAGSEGALTKGPFNCLQPIIDLNNALVSFILTDFAGFSSAAGYVGPKYRVDHDISLLVPEIWSRMFIHERDPQYLISNGFLEKCEDFEHKGKTVLASRLGYRITDRFAQRFLARIFGNPETVFDEAMLKPETQDMDIYVEGIEAIVATQQSVATNYFADGSIEDACPPLRALLHIMKDGTYEGKTIDDPEVRKLFTRSSLIESNWYKRRLEAKQAADIERLERLQNAIADARHGDRTLHERDFVRLDQLAKHAERDLENCRSPHYLERLRGTIGLDPATRKTKEPAEPVDMVAEGI